MDFQPSDVNATRFIEAGFQETEANVSNVAMQSMAAQVVTFLAVNKNDWDEVVSLAKFLPFTNENDLVIEEHRKPFQRFFDAGAAIMVLRNIGMIQRISGSADFIVTESFIEFCATYVE